MRILVAEDDSTSRTVLIGVLSKFGYETVVAINGKDALRILEGTEAPPLAIIDWMMPGTDGLEVVRRVREIKTERPVYIIMLTAKGGKTDIIEGLDAGANDYVLKPFDPGELRARVEVGRRMVELQEALFESREALAVQAMTDPLTGMMNRRAIIAQLQKEIARSGRESHSISVGLFDIDHFKHINDTYGHQTGDDVLVGLSKSLSECLRVYDTVGRIGGEEFLVVSINKTSDECCQIFERLRKQVGEHGIETRTGTVSITVSIGVVCSAQGSTVDEVLGMADAALYRAKENGRNRVVSVTAEGRNADTDR